MPLSVPRTYAELRSSVQGALIAGQRDIERAKVMTYWETGRLINEHILLNSARADYGAQVFSRRAFPDGMSSLQIHCERAARDSF